MKYKILLNLIKFIIFYNKYDFVNTKALIGTGIRSARQGEFSSVVCIVTIDPSNSDPDDIVICTGVLISSTHVLTSEHCLVPDTEPFQVLVGSIDLQNGTRHSSMWWLTHDWWAISNGHNIDNPLNDIAMIRLLQHAPEEVSPAIVTFQPNSVFFGSEVKITGWGTSNYGKSPRILEIVSVTIISNEACERLALDLQGFRSRVPPKYICSVKEPYVHLKDGDSGGPVFYRNQVIAISEGTCPSMNDQFHSRKANIHNSIYFYRSFIIQTMNITLYEASSVLNTVIKLFALGGLKKYQIRFNDLYY